MSLKHRVHLAPDDGVVQDPPALHHGRHKLVGDSEHPTVLDVVGDVDEQGTVWFEDTLGVIKGFGEVGSKSSSFENSNYDEHEPSQIKTAGDRSRGGFYL